ncbi:MAG: SDR family oxidoreductase [Bacteroidales bacterium]|nr:SDR family oxidoreductase [Bacteroidales bacterium]
MKVLFIGGTGNISSACIQPALEKNIDMYLLTRGKSKIEVPAGVNFIHADIHNSDEVIKILKDQYFDVVVNFIVFKPQDVERDIKLFKGKTAQYIFISSASVYQKPPVFPYITESCPLKNPFWEYSQDKIACENILMKAYREQDFPVTIVRPSLTYNTVIPVAIGSWEDYTIIDRMKRGKKIIIHGDGSSLWTITHADDFAKGFVGLLGHQQAIGHAFHITSDEVLTWNQIYEDVAEAAGVKLNAVHIASDFICKIGDQTPGMEWMRGNLPGDKAVSAIFDNTKIKTFVPGFTATIPFKEGFKRTLEWFEADPARKRIVKENNDFMDKVIAAYEKM